MITFQSPLNHERSMKYNLYHFQRVVLDKAPRLAIAIFNNNTIGELAGPYPPITLLHALDRRGSLPYVPLEFQLSSQHLSAARSAPPYNRSPSTSILYAFTPGAADATAPMLGSEYINLPVPPRDMRHLEIALGFPINMSSQSPMRTILDGQLDCPVNIEDYLPSSPTPTFPRASARQDGFTRSAATSPVVPFIRNRFSALADGHDEEAGGQQAGSSTPRDQQGGNRVDAPAASVQAPTVVVDVGSPAAAQAATAPEPDVAATTAASSASTASRGPTIMGTALTGSIASPMLSPLLQVLWSDRVSDRTVLKGELVGLEHIPRFCAWPAEFPDSTNTKAVILDALPVLESAESVAWARFAHITLPGFIASHTRHDRAPPPLPAPPAPQHHSPSAPTTTRPWRRDKAFSLNDTQDRTPKFSALTAFITLHNCTGTALNWIPNLLIDKVYDALTLDREAVTFITKEFGIPNDLSTVSSLVASVRPPDTMDPLETILGFHPQAPALLIALLKNTSTNAHTDTSSTILKPIREFTLELAGDRWNAQHLIDELLDAKRLADALDIPIPAHLWTEALYGPLNSLGEGRELSHATDEEYRRYATTCRKNIREGNHSGPHDTLDRIIAVLRPEAHRTSSCLGAHNTPNTAQPASQAPSHGAGRKSGTTTPNPSGSTADNDDAPIREFRPFDLNPGNRWFNRKHFGAFKTLPCLNQGLCNPPTCKHDADTCAFKHNVHTLSTQQRKYVNVLIKSATKPLPLNTRAFAQWQLSWADLSDSLKEGNPGLNPAPAAMSFQLAQPPAIPVAAVMAPIPSLHALGAAAPPPAFDYPSHTEIHALWLQTNPHADEISKHNAMTIQQQYHSLRSWYRLGCS